jgi:hypothetical protein
VYIPVVADGLNFTFGPWHTVKHVLWIGDSRLKSDGTLAFGFYRGIYTSKYSPISRFKSLLHERFVSVNAFNPSKALGRDRTIL